MQVNGDLEVDGNFDMLGTTSLKIPATAKLYLDGGGDTYFIESSANTVSLFTNGAVAWTTNTTSLTLGSGLDLTLLTTKKLNFNVGGTAYAYESATNVIDIYANSGKLFTIDGANSFVKVNTGIDFAIAATKKLYLDAGTNTYIQESAADTVGIYTNATLGLQVSTTLVSIGSARDLAVTATKKIFLDGGGDTYFIETSANTAEIFTGGTRRCTFGSSGLSNVTITSPTIAAGALSGTFSGNPTFSDEVIFANIDPPTANRVNRNGIVKGWWNGSITTTTSNDDYNVSSITKNGTGDLTIAWDTNFASNNYAVSVTASAVFADLKTAFYISSTTSELQIGLYDVGSLSASDGSLDVIAIGDQ